jgi:hypothetical protein
MLTIFGPSLLKDQPIFAKLYCRIGGKCGNKQEHTNSADETRKYIYEMHNLLHIDYIPA